MHRAPADFRGALVGIWGSGGRDIWVVGASGTVLHWNGTAWSDVDAGVESHTLVGVWGSGPHDVWLVGGQRGHPSLGREHLVNLSERRRRRSHRHLG